MKDCSPCVAWKCFVSRVTAHISPQVHGVQALREKLQISSVSVVAKKRYTVFSANLAHALYVAEIAKIVRRGHINAVHLCFSQHLFNFLRSNASCAYRCKLALWIYPLHVNVKEYAGIYKRLVDVSWCGNSYLFSLSTATYYAKHCLYAKARPLGRVKSPPAAISQ